MVKIQYFSVDGQKMAKKALKNCLEKSQVLLQLVSAELQGDLTSENVFFVW